MRAVSADSLLAARAPNHPGVEAQQRRYVLPPLPGPTTHSAGRGNGGARRPDRRQRAYTSVRAIPQGNIARLRLRQTQHRPTGNCHR